MPSYEGRRILSLYNPKGHMCTCFSARWIRLLLYHCCHMFLLHFNRFNGAFVVALLFAISQSFSEFYCVYSLLQFARHFSVYIIGLYQCFACFSTITTKQTYFTSQWFAKCFSTMTFCTFPVQYFSALLRCTVLSFKRWYCCSFLFLYRPDSDSDFETIFYCHSKEPLISMQYENELLEIKITSVVFTIVNVRKSQRPKPTMDGSTYKYCLWIQSLIYM